MFSDGDFLKKDFFFSTPKNRLGAFFLSVFSTVHTQALLGILFVISSLPVLTLLSSWTTLFLLSKKLLRGEDVRAFKDYFSVFFSLFKRTILPSALFSLFFGVAIFAVRLCFSAGGALSVIGGILCVSSLLFSAMCFLFFPCCVFEKRKNVFLLFERFVTLLPRLALSLLSVLLISGTLLLLLPYSLPIVLSLCFPLSCLICAFLLDKEEKEE